MSERHHEMIQLEYHDPSLNPCILYVVPSQMDTIRWTHERSATSLRDLP